jgi:hypothetical protein
VTAKEKLREAVEQLSEEEARDALRYLAERSDPLMELLDDAPEDEEPLTPEEYEGLREARAQAERGETVPLDELRRELG